MRMTVHGQIREVRARGTLLDALREFGVEVPTLCHDDRLKPHPVCRMCIVEVEGCPHPVPSCSTPIEGGMVVRSRSSTIDTNRRVTLTLLAHRHPLESLRAPQEHPFARYLHEYALEGELSSTERPRRHSAFLGADERRVQRRCGARTRRAHRSLAGCRGSCSCAAARGGAPHPRRRTDKVPHERSVEEDRCHVVLRRDRPRQRRT